MTAFQKILVYIESERAGRLEQVVALSERLGAELTICGVVSRPPALPDPDGVIARLGAIDFQRALEWLYRITDPFRYRIKMDYVILTGNPFLAVTEQVMRQGFDLVIHIGGLAESAGTRGLNPNAMHLVRKCPSAVWVEGDAALSRLDDIVIGVDRDLSGQNPETEQQALALAATASVVAPPGARLHVVHAWEPYAWPLLQASLGDFEQSTIDTYLTTLEHNYRDWMTDLVKRMQPLAPNLALQMHLVRGGVDVTIQQVVAACNAGLVVMGTVGTSDVPVVLIGTHAEAILQHSSVPVLTLKPRHFKSPLNFFGRRQHAARPLHTGG